MLHTKSPSEDVKEPLNKPSLYVIQSLATMTRVVGLGALLAIAPFGTADARAKDGSVEVADNDNDTNIRTRRLALKV